MTYPAAITITYNTIMQSDVFRLDGPSIDLPRALTLLGQALYKYELPEGIWCDLGEFSDACLGDLVVGAYWACSEWHGGQFSDTYAALCSLGLVFSPGMSNAPEPEESEYTAYELIGEWFNPNSLTMPESHAHTAAVSVAKTIATWHRIATWAWRQNPQPRQLSRADRRFLIESTDWRNDADPEAVREYIENAAREYPLSLCVRCESWYPVGSKLEPDSWEVLLCTGGPAVRIIGDLNCADCPKDPVLQCQDWGTPWQDVDCDAEALLWFAELFTYA